MIAAIRKRIDQEGGFTLIELLVVVIIIGILAAIAIPAFLGQRESAHRSAVESDLRNAAIELETYYTDEGSYPDDSDTDITDIDDLDVTTTDGVTVDYDEADPYLLTGTHEEISGESIDYDPNEGGLQEWGD